MLKREGGVPGGLTDTLFDSPILLVGYKLLKQMVPRFAKVKNRNFLLDDPTWTACNLIQGRGTIYFSNL